MVPRRPWLALLLGACTSLPRSDACLNDPAQVQLLEATIVSSSVALELPTDLTVVGGYLVVLDAASDSVLHMLDKNNGQVVQSLGRRGRGPGEFLGAWSVEGSRDMANHVWVYDLSLRRLTLVGLGLANGGEETAARMVRFVDGSIVTGPMWLDAATLVTPGFFSDVRLALYDTTGVRITNTGEPPFSPDVLRNAFQLAQAQLGMSADREHLVLASRYRSTLELFDAAARPVGMITGPVRVADNERSPGTNRLAYLDVAMTSNEIVALFSGREARAFGPSASFGRCLHVFGNDGQLRAASKANVDLLAITLEPSDGRVYGIIHDPRPAVVAFPWGLSGQPIALADQRSDPR